MPQFNHDEDIDKLVKRVIRKHHKHLIMGKVKALLKSTAVGKKMAEQEAGKKPKITHVYKLPEWMTFLTGHSFVIQIDENYWAFLKPEIQEAIIDEALCQMGHDEKGPYLIDPDVVIYTGVIERHGFYTEQLQEVRARISQLNLFPEGGKKEEAVQ